jgi:hypothetical protein
MSDTQEGGAVLVEQTHSAGLRRLVALLGKVSQGHGASFRLAFEQAYSVGAAEGPDAAATSLPLSFVVEMLLCCRACELTQEVRWLNKLVPVDHSRPMGAENWMVVSPDLAAMMTGFGVEHHRPNPVQLAILLEQVALESQGSDYSSGHASSQASSTSSSEAGVLHAARHGLTLAQTAAVAARAAVNDVVAEPAQGAATSAGHRRSRRTLASRAALAALEHAAAEERCAQARLAAAQELHESARSVVFFRQASGGEVRVLLSLPRAHELKRRLAAYTRRLEAGIPGQSVISLPSSPRRYTESAVLRSLATVDLHHEIPCASCFTPPTSVSDSDADGPTTTTDVYVGYRTDLLRTRRGSQVHYGGCMQATAQLLAWLFEGVEQRGGEHSGPSSFTRAVDSWSSDEWGRQLAMEGWLQSELQRQAAPGGGDDGGADGGGGGGTKGREGCSAAPQ